jgi:uncharacterized protein
METFTLLVTGALSGFVAGLVGLAGGIVVVPALTALYGPAALHDAIVVSWFAVLFNSFGAASKQYRVRSTEERVELVSNARYYALGTMFVTPVVAGILGGSKHLITAPMVAVLQLCLAFVMLWPVSESQGTRRSNPYMDASFGGLIGGVSVLIGVGGGTYTIAYFVYAAKRKFQDAIATANMTGLIIGALSVFGYLISLALTQSAGAATPHESPITAVGMVILIVSGVLFSSLGVRLSRRMPVKILRKILVFALMLSAIRLLTA